jgi:hypothetical protein
MSIWSWLMNQTEADSENYFGAGPFKPLPKDHPFQRAAFLHDWQFERSHEGKAEESLAECDEKLFWRMALLAHNQTNPKVRCELMLDICRYWPIARRTGWLFWEGDE